MKYIVVLFFLILSSNAFSQAVDKGQTVTGTILNDHTKFPLSNVNIININKVRGTTTDDRGNFELAVSINDTLHITCIGFESLRIKVTNDWVKTKTTTIQLTEKAYVLNEVIVGQYNLTGYLEIDSKLIPITKNNYRYSINGLTEGYETGNSSPGAFNKIMGSIFNPADALYNFFGKKPYELKRLKEMKKDDTVRNLLETKYDRETVAVLLGIEKKEVAEILGRCNYSEAFIKTANDLQILDAISSCYEEYKILKRK